MAVRLQVDKTRGDISHLVDDYDDLSVVYPHHGDEAWVINEQQWYKYESNSATWRRFPTYLKPPEVYVADDGSVIRALNAGTE